MLDHYLLSGIRLAALLMSFDAFALDTIQWKALPSCSLLLCSLLTSSLPRASLSMSSLSIPSTELALFQSLSLDGFLRVVPLHSTDLSINFAFDDLHCWRALFALFLQSLVVNLLTPLSANQSEFILTKSRFSSQYASIHMVARFSKTKTIGILKIDRKSNNLITLNASDSAPEFQSHNRTIMGAE